MIILNIEPYNYSKTAVRKLKNIFVTKRQKIIKIFWREKKFMQ